MTGGIRRRAAAYKQLAKKGATLILENGGFTAGDDRQSVLKAEALAEALGMMGTSAINFGWSDARIAEGFAETARRLSKATILASEIGAGPLDMDFNSLGFLIGGLAENPAELAKAQRVEPTATSDTVHILAARAKVEKSVLVLMNRSQLEEAKKTAGAASLVIYRSDAKPTSAPIMVGQTAFVTPGDKGKQFLYLEMSGSKISAYRVIELGPQFQDDPSVSLVYSLYQRRVGEERLLDRAPRSSTKGFAGSAACLPCHSQAAEVWKQSQHSGALATLEKVGSDRDPDCVGCHVVGLDSTVGFKSRKDTAHLADVGCESCHGPGADHSIRPTEVLMGKVRKDVCMTCHNPAHDPEFDYDRDWKKIAH